VRGQLGRRSVWLCWQFEHKAFGLSPAITEWQLQIAPETADDTTEPIWMSLDINPTSVTQNIKIVSDIEKTWCGCANIKHFAEQHPLSTSRVVVRVRGVCERGPGAWSDMCVLDNILNIRPTILDSSLEILEFESKPEALSHKPPTDLCCLERGQSYLVFKWSVSESVADEIVGFQLHMSPDGVVWPACLKYSVSVPMHLSDGSLPPKSTLVENKVSLITEWANGI
jgi:hypothetical protein